MKAQVRKSDNTVGRFWPSTKTLELTSDKLIVSDGSVEEFIDADATTENTIIVDGLDQPGDFQPHKYECVDGDLNVVDGWVNLAITEEEIEIARLASEARNKRNQILASTDWTASSDITMSDAMTAYRQALRDVPAQSGFPTTINWPELGE